jgi:putative inorganic carbon (HCO3(-)) transporter
MTFAAYLLLIAVTVLHPFESLTPALATYRPALILSAIVLVMAVFEAMARRKISARPVHFLLLAAFAATIAISVALSGWVGGMVPALVEFSVPALMFVLTAMIVTNMSRLKMTCGVLVLCMVVLSVAGISAYHYGFLSDELVVRESTGNEDHLAHVGEGVIPAEDTSGLSLWRIHSWGFLSDPNDFSQAIIMVLPMLMGAWLRRRPLRNLLRIWLPCSLLLYAAYLTHSRGATLGFCVVVMFALMRRFGTVASTIAVAGLGFAGAMIGVTGGRSISSGDESAGGRIEAWSAGFEMLRANPLFGVGYGQFTEHHYYTAHNSFVLCFAELGMVGYYFWIALLVMAFKELQRASRMTVVGSDEHRWAVLLRLSLLGFLTCALFLSRTYQPMLYILLALCFACGYCAELRAEPNQQEQTRSVQWFATTLQVIVVSIVTLYLIVRFQSALLN